MLLCSKYLTIAHTFAHVRIQVRRLSDQQEARTPLSKRRTAEDTIVAKVLDRRQRIYRETPEASSNGREGSGAYQRESAYTTLNMYLSFERTYDTRSGSPLDDYPNALLLLKFCTLLCYGLNLHS